MHIFVFGLVLLGHGVHGLLPLGLVGRIRFGRRGPVGVEGPSLRKRTCSGLHSSAVGRALIGLIRLTLAGIIGGVWLTLGDRGRGLRDTDLHSSAPAHAR